jgi:hypothetical protein
VEIVNKLEKKVMLNDVSNFPEESKDIIPHDEGNGQDTRIRCKALNAKGQPCAGWAMSSGYCWVHNPEVAEERHKARVLGGATNQAQHSPRVNLGQVPKEIRTIEDILVLMDFAKDEILMLNNGLNRNKALVQLASTYAAILKDGDMEDRVGDLETVIKELHEKTTGKR